MQVAIIPQKLPFFRLNKNRSIGYMGSVRSTTVSYTQVVTSLPLHPAEQIHQTHQLKLINLIIILSL
jgi:hypothetical protein